MRKTNNRCSSKTHTVPALNFIRIYFNAIANYTFKAYASNLKVKYQNMQNSRTNYYCLNWTNTNLGTTANGECADCSCSVLALLVYNKYHFEDVYNDALSVVSYNNPN